MSQFAGLPLNIFAADAWLKQVTYGIAHTSNPDSRISTRIWRFLPLIILRESDRIP
jgi:hypothetical protein